VVMGAEVVVMSTFGASTRGRTFPVEILSPAEVRSLMSSCSTRGSCGVRDRAMIATMYRAGLRVAELTALLPKDIDTATGTIRVLRGKGGKQRAVAVDIETSALIELWLVRRTKLTLPKRSPLFCTLLGRPLSRVQITQKLKALALKAGIEKRVHPHGLRHSFSVSMMQSGQPVPIIQRALGHSSLQTTATYLNHISDEDVLEAMRGRSW